MKQSKIHVQLPFPQRQAIIKEIAEKDKWRPISLLYVDTKILSKSLREKSKYVLSKLISSNQTAYVNSCYVIC